MTASDASRLQACQDVQGIIAAKQDAENRITMTGAPVAEAEVFFGAGGSAPTLIHPDPAQAITELVALRLGLTMALLPAGGSPRPVTAATPK